MKTVDTVEVAKNEVHQRCEKNFKNCKAIIVLKHHDKIPSDDKDRQETDARIHNILNKTGHSPLVTNKTPNMRMLGFGDINTCSKVIKYINRLLADAVSCQMIVHVVN